MDSHCPHLGFHSSSSGDTTAVAYDDTFPMAYMDDDSVTFTLDTLSIPQPEPMDGGDNLMDSDSDLTSEQYLMNDQYMPASLEPKHLTSSEAQFDLAAAGENIVIRIINKMADENVASAPAPQTKLYNDLSSYFHDGNLGASVVDVRSALLEASPLPSHTGMNTALSRDLEACADTIELLSTIVSFLHEQLTERTSNMLTSTDESDRIIDTAFGPISLSTAIPKVLIRLEGYFNAVKQSIDSKRELMVQHMSNGDMDELTLHKFGMLHMLCEQAVPIVHDSIGFTMTALAVIWGRELKATFERQTQKLMSNIEGMGLTWSKIAEAITVDDLINEEEEDEGMGDVEHLT